MQGNVSGNSDVVPDTKASARILFGRRMSVNLVGRGCLLLFLFLMPTEQAKLSMYAPPHPVRDADGCSLVCRKMALRKTGSNGNGTHIISPQTAVRKCDQQRRSPHERRFVRTTCMCRPCFVCLTCFGERSTRLTRRVHEADRKQARSKGEAYTKQGRSIHEACTKHARWYPYACRKQESSSQCDRANAIPEPGGCKPL